MRAVRAADGARRGAGRRCVSAAQSAGECAQGVSASGGQGAGAARRGRGYCGRRERRPCRRGRGGGSLLPYRAGQGAAGAAREDCDEVGVRTLCRSAEAEFLCGSEIMLWSLLRRFKDHRMLVVKRGRGGQGMAKVLGMMTSKVSHGGSACAQHQAQTFS